MKQQKNEQVLTEGILVGTTLRFKIMNEPIKDKESHINFWAPTSLRKRLKQHSLDNDESIKDICTKALTEYLNRKAIVGDLIHGEFELNLKI